MGKLRYAFAAVLVITISVLLIVLFNSTHRAYRLGDMVCLRIKRMALNGRKYHFDKYPNSIATEYMKTTSRSMDLTVLDQIVKMRTVEKPANDTLCVHVRCGDTLDRIPDSVDHIWHSETFTDRYIKGRKYYIDAINDFRQFPIKNVIIFTKQHLSIDNVRSKTYINHIRTLFSEEWSVTIRADGDADDDFVFMANAAYFIRSGGYFSILLGLLVDKNGGVSYPA
jgi:hypothetical protein